MGSRGARVPIGTLLRGHPRRRHLDHRCGFQLMLGEGRGSVCRQCSGRIVGLVVVRAGRRRGQLLWGSRAARYSVVMRSSSWIGGSASTSARAGG